MKIIDPTTHLNDGAKGSPYAWCGKKVRALRAHGGHRLRYSTSDVALCDCPDCLAEYAANSLVIEAHRG